MIAQDLKTLEEKSIYIIREAKLKFKNIAALWSMGKDSTTMLALTRKAFLGKIPFPVIHIDNGIDFPETYAFREELAKKWNFKVIVGHSEIKPDPVGSACCGKNKPDTLKKIMKEYKFDALIVSIRRDEHGIRAKERFFCFPESSIVYGEAIKKIEDVSEGDVVFTHLGSERKVTGVSKRDYTGPMLSIFTEYNGMPLRLTSNHVVLAKVVEPLGKENHVVATGFDGIQRQITIPLYTDRIKWIDAGSLKVGNYLWIPKLPKKPQDGVSIPTSVSLKPIIEDRTIVKRGRQFRFKSSHTDSPWIRNSLPLEPRFLRAIGCYVAEGSSNKSSNQFEFALNKREAEVVQHLLSTIKEFFGINGVVRKVSENGISVVFNSKALMLAFSNLCGIGAHNKKLPFFFMSLSNLQLTELVRGCWIGDGSGETYSTVSSTLAYQLRLALLRLKILSSIRQTSDGRFIVQIAGVSKARFASLFGIEPKTPYIGRLRRAREVSELNVSKLSTGDFGKSRAGGFWIKIKRIERTDYTGQVYDLAIDDHQSYLVNGIAVHNSPRDKAFKWDYKNQPAELWDDYSSKQEDKSHIRVHPLLDWNEIDIWRYIKQEHVPINPLYFSRNGFRYRSLGCTHCTIPLKSNAKNVDDIIKELETTKQEERSGRSMDKESEYTMLRLRSLGYM